MHVRLIRPGYEGVRMSDQEGDFPAIKRLSEENIEDLESEEKIEVLQKVSQEFGRAADRVEDLIEEAEEHQKELAKEMNNLQSLREALNTLYKDATQASLAVEVAEMGEDELEGIENLVRAAELQEEEVPDLSQELPDESLEDADLEQE